MIREFTIAAVGVTIGAAVVLAPAAGADPIAYPDNPGHYATDVPGMNYDAHLTAPCDNTDIFTFGRGPGGEALACHYIGKQNSGYWQISYPLVGQQDIGSPCPGIKFASQSPDGRPMVCLGDQGWQPGTIDLIGFPRGFVPG